MEHKLSELFDKLSTNEFFKKKTIEPTINKDSVYLSEQEINEFISELGSWKIYASAPLLRGWTRGDVEAVRDAYRNLCDGIPLSFSKKTTVAQISIMDIVGDISDSKIINPFSKANNRDNKYHDKILFRLARHYIFLIHAEKVLFAKWSAADYHQLENKIDKLAEREKFQEDTKEIKKDIKSFILGVNCEIELAEKRKAAPAIVSRYAYIRDLIIKLQTLGVIDVDSIAGDVQFNKCLKWPTDKLYELGHQVDLVYLDFTLMMQPVIFIEDIKKRISEYNAPFDPKPDVASFLPLEGLITISPGGEVNLNGEKITINGREVDIDKIAKDPEPLKVRVHDPSDDSIYEDISIPWPITEQELLEETTLPLINPLTNEFKKASVRVAATQLNKLTKGILSNALPGDKSAVLQQFLNSELGTSFASMISGVALTYALEDNEVAQTMAKEFRVSGMTTAGNFAVEEILSLVSDVVLNTLDNSLETRLEEATQDPEIEILYEDLDEESILHV